MFLQRREMTMLAFRLSGIHWQSGVDFLVLTVALHFLLQWSRQARAFRLALSILALRVGALLARQLDLLITSWVLDAATVIAGLALLIVFQPELRRALMRLDIRGRVRRTRKSPHCPPLARRPGPSPPRTVARSSSSGEGIHSWS